MDVFKLPLASSLCNKQYMDNVLQKQITSPSSLQNTLSSVGFIPVDYVKETSEAHKHFSLNHNNTLIEKQTSANSSVNDTDEEGGGGVDKEKSMYTSNNNFKNRTIYALQVYYLLKLLDIIVMILFFFRIIIT